MLGARRVKTHRVRGLALASLEESTVGYPVFEKMVGKWDDSVRYVHENMQETPRIQLSGTREVRPRRWALTSSTFREIATKRADPRQPPARVPGQDHPAGHRQAPLVHYLPQR